MLITDDDWSENISRFSSPSDVIEGKLTSPSGITVNNLFI